jgi:GST-like protein
LYGAKGSGAVAVEAALTLIGQPYDLVEAYAWSGPEEAAKVAPVNPMRQVPTLILPDGEVMTESAAILIWLAEAFPEARLAPGPDDPVRPAFLRWMAFVSASIYSLYWVKDDPSRLTKGKAAEAVLVERTLARIAECWGIMDAQVRPGRYLLGEDLTVLDLYVAVVSRFRPRRRRFYEVAPHMSAAVRAVDDDPRLAAFWTERFPFAKGWEG